MWPNQDGIGQATEIADRKSTAAGCAAAATAVATTVSYTEAATDGAATTASAAKGNNTMATRPTTTIGPTNVILF